MLFEVPVDANFSAPVPVIDRSDANKPWMITLTDELGDLVVIQTTRMDDQTCIDMTIDQQKREIINIRLTKTDEAPQDDVPSVILGELNYLITAIP